jgi:uncharacterized protein
MHRDTAAWITAAGTKDAAPVSAVDRFESLDVLRGVAVLGILVMNIYAFAMPFAAYSNPLVMGGREWYNLATWFTTHVLFDQKFMSIFSMLFGAGIVLMMNRLEARGAPFRAIFFRRQFWLLIIGALHAYLLWFGDILFFYAVTGAAVYLFRHRSPRALLLTGAVFLLAGLLMLQGTSRFMVALEHEAQPLAAARQSGDTLTAEQQGTLDAWEQLRQTFAPTDAELRAEVETYRGSYAEILERRAPEVAMMQVQALPFFFLWRVGGLMLFGMALMKMGLLTGRQGSGVARRMIAWGYGLGLPLALWSAVNAYAHGFDSVYMLGPGAVPNYVGSVLLALGHTGLVLWLLGKGKLAGLLNRCGAVGRMALSNYLLQSLVMTAIFYGYGLALYAEVPRLAQMSFVLGLMGIQLVLSPWWLTRFRFGPAEWAWRSLTYWRRQPMHRSA